MQQYFMEEILQCEKTFSFNKEQSHHIRKVMRMRENDIVKVVDREGTPFLSSIHFKNDGVNGFCVKSLEKKEEVVQITLLQGMIKKDKWDFLIQKTCELGVSSIVPMISSRTIVKVDAQDKKKLERYNKIALEACEQCKRDSLVFVEEPISLRECERYKSELNLVAYEEADAKSENIKDVLRAHSDIRSITCVVGSEGGFSKAEIAYLKECGFVCVSLGSRILRAETAAMSLVGTMMYEYE